MTFAWSSPEAFERCETGPEKSVIVRRGLLGANRPSELRESYLDEVAAIHGEAA
jgi:hypothetical protein